MALTDEEALELRAGAPEDRYRLKEIDREIKQLQDERRLVEADLYVGDRVRIHKGRPYWSPYGDYESLDEARRASYSKRAVDEFFNVAIKTQKHDGFYSEDTIVKVTESHAKQMCLAWVLDGIHPQAQRVDKSLQIT